MTEDQAKEIALVISTRGYIVINSNNEYRLGHTIQRFESAPGPLVVHPFTVTAVTNQADYAEQLELLGEQIPKGYELKPYFYRCITD